MKKFNWLTKKNMVISLTCCALWRKVANIPLVHISWHCPTETKCVSLIILRSFLILQQISYHFEHIFQARVFFHSNYHLLRKISVSEETPPVQQKEIQLSTSQKIKRFKISKIIRQLKDNRRTKITAPTSNNNRISANTV